jgi:hypothetical protein
MLTSIFERFLTRYPLPDGRAQELWDMEPLLDTPGYLDLARQAAGLPLCGGLLRLVGARDGPNALEFVREGFPEFASRAVPFAIDWIGRLVAIDQARPPGLVLIEPGSADAFEIEESLRDYFNVDLVDDPDTFLATDLFREWHASGGGLPGPGQCVGFKVPLFLGGAGAATNLEVTDLQVYWSFSAQLRAQTRGLARGTQVRGVSGFPPD